MFTFEGLLIGGVMTILGVLMVKYTFKLVNMTGRQDWIERYAGSGTTYGIYKIFGVLLVFVGLLVATGFGDEFMNLIFAPLRDMFTSFQR